MLDEAGRPIPRLYAAGELVGGLFWDNYPGGAGLMAGAVFGRRAGLAAAGKARFRPTGADTLRAAFRQGRSIASNDGRGACRAGRIG